jgi:hypothetical protein
MTNHLSFPTWCGIVATAMTRTAAAGPAAVARKAGLFAGLTSGTVLRHPGKIVADMPVSTIITPADLAKMGTYGRHDRKDTATVRRVLRSTRANYAQQCKVIMAAAIADHGLNPAGARVAVQCVPNNARPEYVRVTVYRDTTR